MSTLSVLRANGRTPSRRGGHAAVVATAVVTLAAVCHFAYTASHDQAFAGVSGQVAPRRAGVAMGATRSQADWDEIPEGMPRNPRLKWKETTGGRILAPHNYPTMPWNHPRQFNPKGLRSSYLKRMPMQEKITFEQMLQRIVTVLIRNIDEGFFNGPPCTTQIKKWIGLRGDMFKNSNIQSALQLLRGQQIIWQVYPNRGGARDSATWEIHEEYRKNGVPPISRDPRDPWKLAHLLKFPRMKLYKYGPQHGTRRPINAIPLPVRPYPPL